MTRLQQSRFFRAERRTLS